MGVKEGSLRDFPEALAHKSARSQGANIMKKVRDDEKDELKR
jgi:hypothetical protein